MGLALKLQAAGPPGSPGRLPDSSQPNTSRNDKALEDTIGHVTECFGHLFTFFQNPRTLEMAGAILGYGKSPSPYNDMFGLCNGVVIKAQPPRREDIRSWYTDTETTGRNNEMIIMPGSLILHQPVSQGNVDLSTQFLVRAADFKNLEHLIDFTSLLPDGERRIFLDEVYKACEAAERLYKAPNHVGRSTVSEDDPEDSVSEAGGHSCRSHRPLGLFRSMLATCAFSLLIPGTAAAEGPGNSVESIAIAKAGQPGTALLFLLLRWGASTLCAAGFTIYIYEKLRPRQVQPRIRTQWVAGISALTSAIAATIISDTQATAEIKFPTLATAMVLQYLFYETIIPPRDRSISWLAIFGFSGATLDALILSSSGFDHFAALLPICIWSALLCACGL